MRLQKFNDEIFAHQKTKENPDVIVRKMLRDDSSIECEVVSVVYVDGRIEILTK